MRKICSDNRAQLSQRWTDELRFNPIAILRCVGRKSIHLSLVDKKALR